MMTVQNSRRLEGVKCVKCVCYTSINFFILFYRPAKTDVCDNCTELKKGIERGGPNLARLQERLQAHKAEARDQQLHLQHREEQCPIDAQNEYNVWITIATDLQQTQPVPKLNNQSAFYEKNVSKNNILFF